MPATGALIGQPASISAIEPAHTLAIDDEPFDSRMSLTMRIVYGKCWSDGITGSIEQVVGIADMILMPARPSPHDLRAVGGTVQMAHRAGKPFMFIINGAGVPLGTDQRFYFLCLGLLIAGLWLTANLLRSPTGRAWVAIRDSEVAASVMGVNVPSALDMHLHAADGIGRCIHGLPYIPYGGIVQGMDDKIRKSSLARLARIEGQVRGVSRMVEADRYCIDIVTQISAVRAALRRAEEEILKDHVGHCVDTGKRRQDRRDQDRNGQERACRGARN